MSNLDYFLITEDIGPACSEVRIDRQQPIVRPHTPVAMALSASKPTISKVATHQRLETDPDFEIVLGPTGGLTIPPCVQHSYITMQESRRDGSRLTEQGKPQWKQKEWQHYTVH